MTQQQGWVQASSELSLVTSAQALGLESGSHSGSYRLQTQGISVSDSQTLGLLTSTTMPNQILLLQTAYEVHLSQLLPRMLTQKGLMDTTAVLRSKTLGWHLED